MSWEGGDFDWNQARAFLATVSEGSLSAAARKLGQTQPTLSRQVAALERQLGVTLFERVGKQLVLTETGRNLAESGRGMRDAANLVALVASGRSQAVYGLVRITAAEGVAVYLLPSIVERLRARYPQIEIELVVSNQLRDLRRREADIAIRHVRPEQPDLFARKVRDSSAHLYAAKRWLRRHGRPRRPEDLEGVTFVGADDNPRFVRILASLGVRVSLDNFKLASDSHVVAWELVRRGLGVGAALEELAQATPEVEQILPSLPPIPVPYWLCTHRELHTSRRMRLVFDFLAQELSPATPPSGQRATLGRGTATR